jgi:hypothetical protein
MYVYGEYHTLLAPQGGAEFDNIHIQTHNQASKSLSKTLFWSVAVGQSKI